MNFVLAPAYPGVAVSEDGLVRGSSGKILKLRPSPGGYQHVVLRDLQGIRRSVYIHRLVLIAFVGPAPEGAEACHNNGNPADNRLENLRWDTHDANVQDRIDSRPRCKKGHEWTGWRKNGRGRTRYCSTCRNDQYATEKQARVPRPVVATGSRNRARKLSAEERILVVQQRAQDVPVKAIAQRLGVSAPTVYSVLKEVI